jgi:hypothetical protein
MKKVEIVPYCQLDDGWSISDDQVRHLYRCTEMDGTADQVFSDGTLNSPEEFLLAMQSDANILYVVIAEEQVVGMAWINRFENRCARFHFCMFSNGWGLDSIDIGKQAVDQIIRQKDDHGFLFDMFVGLVPSANVRAIAYVLSLGAVKVGEMPFACYNRKTRQSEPGTLVYYIREEDHEDLRRNQD